MTDTRSDNNEIYGKSQLVRMLPDIKRMNVADVKTKVFALARFIEARMADND